MLRFLAATFTVLGALTISKPALAHCDTTRGPVVTAARAALVAGDPDLVLHWVRPEDEATIRAAFQQTMDARQLGPSAMALADRYFFETLVRIHRAGEGAPYTGLSDGDPEPIITATDHALRRGSPGELENELVTAVRAGLGKRFAAARAAQDFRPGDVAAGRRFVAEYVALTHWVEAVSAAAGGNGGVHAAAQGHDATSHPAGPDRDGHVESLLPAENHRGDSLEHLPWILAILFAVAAVVEGAFLMRQRRHVAA